MSHPSRAETTTASPEAGVRLAELMGVMSLATDVGMGQPMEQLV